MPIAKAVSRERATRLPSSHSTSSKCYCNVLFIALANNFFLCSQRCFDCFWVIWDRWIRKLQQFSRKGSIFITIFAFKKKLLKYTTFTILFPFFYSFMVLHSLFMHARVPFFHCWCNIEKDDNHYLQKTFLSQNDAECENQIKLKKLSKINP